MNQTTANEPVVFISDQGNIPMNNKKSNYWKTEVIGRKALKEIKDDCDLPDWIDESVPVEIEHGGRMARGKFHQEMQRVFDQGLQHRSNYGTYIEESDAYVARGRFLHITERVDDESIEEERGDPDRNCILVDPCPLCDEFHWHHLKPKLMFGGIEQYTCDCKNPYAPDEYYIYIRPWSAPIHCVQSSIRRFSGAEEMFDQYLTPPEIDPKDTDIIR
jgi:hypothetical protein